MITTFRVVEHLPRLEELGLRDASVTILVDGFERFPYVVL
jgi:hypothetical protein